MADTLYVYGTLRPGGQNVVRIPGTLFNLGWFPGIKLEGGGEVVCEPIEVDDWEAVDRYEGYYPDNHAASLYIRRPLVIPYGLNGYIYEYNRAVNPIDRIESGDWLDFTSQERGRYGGRFGNAA